mgnify:FL=1
METSFLQSLAAAVKSKRKKQNLTQEELAGISGVGLRFLVELESGKKSTLQIGKIQQVLKRLGLALLIDEKNKK